MRRDSSRASGSLDLLEACVPVAGSALASEGIEGALDEIGAAIISRPRQAPRAARNRRTGGRRAVLVVAATMLAIGAGVAAGAVVFGAHTGLFPTKAEQAMGGPGEALSPAAPDFRAVALQIASDIPYPKGYASWRESVPAETRPHDFPAADRASRRVRRRQARPIANAAMPATRALLANVCS